MMYCIVYIFSEEAMFNFFKNWLRLKTSRTLSKINDISGVFAGVDDDCGCS